MADLSSIFVTLVLFLSEASIYSFAILNLGPSNQSEAYFNGSSYVRLQTSISLKRQTGISFRTCEGGSLFSQQQNDDLVELTINPDGILFFVRTSGKHYEEMVSGKYLDNRWHTVYLQYKLGNLTISADKRTQLIGNTTYNKELLTSPGLNNEGSAVLLIGKHFTGCILEGPSITFDPSIIVSSPNVIFESCPLTDDSCQPVERSHGYDFCLTEPCLKQGTCVNGQTSYTCTCLPRYTGKNCEIDLGDPCEKNVCQNGAECKSSSSGEYECACAPRYTGKNCESELVVHPLCQNNPCLNYGTCNVHDKTNNVFCTCQPGFGGVNCEVNMDECRSSPCKNGAVCVDGFNNYTCDCTRTGYEGAHCETDVNECLRTNPCLNRGVCFNNYGGYLCQCSVGFDGKNCQYEINECLSRPCENNGVCKDVPGGYECRCPQGFIGKRCELEKRSDYCTTESCSSYADCVNNLCVCKPNYPGAYPNCSVLDAKCLPNPCRNGGVCTGGICDCAAGYTGKLCQVNIDDCLSNPCQNGGSCVDRINDVDCNCPEHWMGKYCEKPFEACELKPCLNNATCISLPNKRDYRCSCVSGFSGEKCEENVNDCEGVVCPSGQICVDLINGHDCACLSGFGGINCSEHVDPCAKCDNKAICQLDKATNQYLCLCPPGFKGTHCDIDIDECNTPGNSICNNGICVNSKGSFQCYCQPGYTGERCNLDFNECLSMPCKNNASCMNKINAYECVCPPGYTGKDCDINIDECDPMPCMTGSTCVDGINEFTCVCQLGLTGKRCEINIDDCESSPCQNGAHCIDGLNSYTCNCTDTGYAGAHCENNIDDCFGNPCVNGAECFDEVKDYRCKCYLGYTGKNCEEDINECESNPCQYNGTCLERSNFTLYHLVGNANVNVQLPDIFNTQFNYTTAAGYECLCVQGIAGKNCEININECESSPCFQGTCNDQIGGYVCECNEGYEGEHCEIDIDECEKYQPCLHGTCVDKKANYFCNCQENYGGKNCSVELMGCANSPCSNKGLCRPYLVNETEHKFNCTCPNGFHGHTCEKSTTMSFSGHSQVTVNSSREEGYDIQFRFKTTLGDGLLALGKGLTYYILELSKGRLNLHSSLLNKWEGVFIGSNLNNSEWQKVFVAINSTHLVLSANDEQSIFPISFNDNYNLSSTSFPVTYIGGRPSDLRKLTHGQPFLVGCTEDVLINGEWVLPEERNLQWLNFVDVDVGCLRQPQCQPNPCHSGGRCTDKWRDFSCTCERPYLGHTCQYNFTAATFGYENITDSLVTVNVSDYARRAVRNIVDISMFIKTRQSKGQIFYLGSLPGTSMTVDETYVAAQLDGGELLVSIQLNGTPESYTVGGVKLDNGYNHLIEVTRNVTLVQVKLNGTEYFRKTISATGTLDAQVLFLGGQPQLRLVRQTDTVAAMTKSEVLPPTAPAAAISSINFKGIIQDVQVSNGSFNMVVEFFPLNVTDLEIPVEFGRVSFENIKQGIYSDDLCKSGPCHHNATCRNTWNDYACECPRGLKGKDCQELEFCELEKCPTGSRCNNLEDGRECVSNASFSANNQGLKYTLTILPNSSKSFTLDKIQLTYRTRSWGTLFFAKYREDYFVVFIYHNQVVVEWRFKGVTDNRVFGKDRFLGQWLTLVFDIKDTTLIGGFRDNVIDENPNFKASDFDFMAFSDLLTKGTLYIGGSDERTFEYRKAIEIADSNMTGFISASDVTTETTITNSLESGESYNEESFLYKVDQNKKTDRFKGCLGELRIGGLLLPFFTNKEMYQTKNYPVRYFELFLEENQPNIGCTLCYDTDCFNSGHCIDSKDTYRCNCPNGFTSDDCSVNINECENNQCQNNATCIDLIAKYSCKCMIGYEGEHCENDINECQSNPCRHGGTCIDSIGTFKCECPEDFVGKQCEAPLLITCDNKPCREGATCDPGPNEKTGNNFTCVCTEGMEGTLCDTPFCVQTPCENTGVCNSTLEVPFCECRRGFEGRLCEINIDDCVSPAGDSPCQNGGICIDGDNRYDCSCNGTGYTGLLCEMDIDECKFDPRSCGRGLCHNVPGTFRCNCAGEPGKCGHGCLLNDPCTSLKPCQHGNCVSDCNGKADYICECEEGFTGKNCTDEKVAASIGESGFNILYVVIPLVLVTIIALAIGMAILVNVARSKRATRGTYSPSAQEFCNPRVELDHVLKPPPEERLI